MICVGGGGGSAGGFSCVVAEGTCVRRSDTRPILRGKFGANCLIYGCFGLIVVCFPGNVTPVCKRYETQIIS